MELSPSPQSTLLPVARANLRTRVVSPVPLGGMVKAMALPSLAGEFVISPVEGELRVRKDAELDRENIPFYNLTISARDRGVPPLSSTMLVGVRVLDINDNDPVLLNLPMNITLSEHAPVSSFVTRILAQDADQGPNALLTFDITAGNKESAFYINSTTGIIYVNRPLDREQVAEYRLTVTVKDNPENIRNARRDFDLLVISIADENDNHPLFTQSSYQAEVMENSPAGRFVLTPWGAGKGEVPPGHHGGGTTGCAPMVPPCRVRPQVSGKGMLSVRGGQSAGDDGFCLYSKWKPILAQARCKLAVN